MMSPELVTILKEEGVFPQTNNKKDETIPLLESIAEIMKNVLDSIQDGNAAEDEERKDEEREDRTDNQDKSKGKSGDKILGSIRNVLSSIKGTLHNGFEGLKETVTKPSFGGIIKYGIIGKILYDLVNEWTDGALTNLIPKFIDSIKNPKGVISDALKDNWLKIAGGLAVLLAPIKTLRLAFKAIIGSLKLGTKIIPKVFGVLGKMLGAGGLFAKMSSSMTTSMTKVGAKAVSLIGTAAKGAGKSVTGAFSALSAMATKATTVTGGVKGAKAATSAMPTPKATTPKPVSPTPTIKTPIPDTAIKKDVLDNESKKALRKTIASNSAGVGVKAIAGIGMLAGALLAIEKGIRGDYAGASMEVGGIFLPSIVGTPLDMGIAVRDIYNKHYGTETTPFPFESDMINDPDQFNERINFISTELKKMVTGGKSSGKYPESVHPNLTIAPDGVGPVATGGNLGLNVNGQITPVKREKQMNAISNYLTVIDGGGSGKSPNVVNAPTHNDNRNISTTTIIKTDPQNTLDRSTPGM